mmetsp:Transcript_7362/g.23448  ORF Transcript_7362/g.23448 Transcript_7362/m.23448 type:complete len:242 (+) Transcript_7362:337-1062(+)
MRLWSQVAQLGVRRVVLTNAFRVEKAYFGSHATFARAYEPELLDGLEQAVCTRLPEVRVEKRLEAFLQRSLDELCPPDVLRLVCHPGDGGVRLHDALAAARSRGAQCTPPRGLLLAIGPEGGWVDFELDLLRRHGFVQVSLGPRILSSDMAVVALTTLASDALASAQAAAESPDASLGRRAGSSAEQQGGQLALASTGPARLLAGGKWALLAQLALGALCFFLGSSTQRSAARARRGLGHH